MSLLKVFEYPHPILKKKAEEVILFNDELKKYLSDHIETMYSYKFCVGLAAPQVGNLQNIITIDISKARKVLPNNGLLILINPEIIELGDFKFVREGCLSIPDYTANVKRAMKITVSYQNENGEKKVLTTFDFEAHAIQHEMDHLNGILFLDKISNPAGELFRRKKI